MDGTYGPAIADYLATNLDKSIYFRSEHVATRKVFLSPLEDKSSCTLTYDMYKSNKSNYIVLSSNFKRTVSMNENTFKKDYHIESLESAYFSTHSYEIEIITLLLSLGLPYSYDNKTLISDATQFHEFVKSAHGGILCCAFDHIYINLKYLEHFFVLHHLPLPTPLFPENDFNTESFFKNFDLDPMRKWSVGDLFSRHYASKSKTDMIFPLGDLEAVSNDHCRHDFDQGAHHLKSDIKKGKFLLKGHFWHCVFNGKDTTIKDQDGMRYIFTLLSNPYKSFKPLELYNSLPKKSLLNSQSNINFAKQNDAHTEGMHKNTYKFYNTTTCTTTEDVKEEIETRLKILCHEKENNIIDEIKYRNEVKKLKESYSIFINRDKQPLDKSLKSIHDSVRARIKCALSCLKESHPGLFEHLSHILTGVDSKLNRAKTYTYRPQLVTEWILHE
ncbi:hypothetical protein [Fundidesulfovibrio soli]|uniref:hypothetical protein n=1 Tax=Fundidesulfovibrio soli TaxID=2922716 RepID=UPI001FAFA157|nr:hypothetical protein [Fundidesulfovibrio soli]